MCLGIPGKIVAVGEEIYQLAQVDVCGVKREVNISLVCEGDPQQLLGQWVLVHVGFAMSILNEIEAKETLKTLISLLPDDDELRMFLEAGEVQDAIR